MEKVLVFLRTHRSVDILLLAVILLAAASNWFSSGLPRGSDALAALPPAAAAKDLLFQYDKLGGWTTHWYLGYPLYYMFASLALPMLWVASIPLGWTVAAKVLYLAFFVLSGIFAYFFVHELTKNRSGSFVAALVYSMTSYHLVEVVFEGHQGCFGMAFMLIPLVFLLTDKTIKGPSAGKVILGGVLVAVLILTHPQILPVVVGPFWVLYVILRLGTQYARGSKKIAPLVACVTILSLGLLLTAFWWLPLRSETANLFDNEYGRGSSRHFETSFQDAVTLSPSSGNAAAWAYSALPFGPVKLLRVLLVVLVASGLVLNWKNKYVWLFASLAVITILLSMGLDAPVNLFGFAYDHVPFFDHIRTPGRFLLMTSLCYAVLAGFGTKSLTAFFSHPDLRLMVAAILCLVVVASTWEEARDAFRTFQLTRDQAGAVNWIAEQDAGRVMPTPVDTWVDHPETRSIINPMVYTQFLEHDTVIGGAPNTAPEWTGAFLDSLCWEATEQPIHLGATLDVLGVDYILVDKTSAGYGNYVLDGSCSRVWRSNTVDVYQNQDPYPRVFILSSVPAQAFTEGTDWEVVSVQFDEIDSYSAIGEADFSMTHPGEYRVDLECAGPCWLILSESYYPGWTARVDGESIPSQRGLGFLNVWHIENAGEHQITLEFTPSASRKIGTIMSAFTLAGMSIFVVGMLLRSKRPCKSRILEG